LGEPIFPQPLDTDCCSYFKFKWIWCLQMVSVNLMSLNA
jgi:hypothetical protein